MVRHARLADAHRYFHVIHRASLPVPLFLRPKDYRDFLQIMREGLERHPLPLLAYSVMNDHWHFVLRAAGTARLARLVGGVATTHAERLRRTRPGLNGAPIYPGSFTMQMVSAPDRLLRVCRYVERHALTEGLVRRAQDWPWCSLADRLSPTPTLPLSGTSFMASETWVRHVNAIDEGENITGRLVPDAGGRDTRDAIRLVDAPESPRWLGHPVNGGQHIVRMRRRAGEHKANAHVEGAEHLRLIEIAGLLKPAKQRRHRPAVPVK